MGVGEVIWLGALAGLLIVAATAVIVSDRYRQRNRLRVVRQERDRSRTAAAAAIRTLRLAAIELRPPATALLGHADRLRGSGPGDEPAASMVALAGQILDLADDLQHHALADASGRVLHMAPVPLLVLLNEAVATARSTLGPSRRSWRLPVDAGDITLHVDRRAMAQVLARVLGCAIRFTHHGDWIDISTETAEDRFALVIADEGSGLPAAQGANGCANRGAGGGAPGYPDSRGLGLGLALARVLMEAHGGLLTIEGAPAVGTRVTLELPLSCLAHREPAYAV